MKVILNRARVKPYDRVDYYLRRRAYDEKIPCSGQEEVNEKTRWMGITHYPLLSSHRVRKELISEESDEKLTKK